MLRTMKVLLVLEVLLVALWVRWLWVDPTRSAVQFMDPDLRLRSPGLLIIHQWVCFFLVYLMFMTAYVLSFHLLYNPHFITKMNTIKSLG